MPSPIPRLLFKADLQSSRPIFGVDIVVNTLVIFSAVPGRRFKEDRGRKRERKKSDRRCPRRRGCDGRASIEIQVGTLPPAPPLLGSVPFFRETSRLLRRRSHLLDRPAKRVYQQPTTEKRLKTRLNTPPPRGFSGPLPDDSPSSKPICIYTYLSRSCSLKGSIMSVEPPPPLLPPPPHLRVDIKGPRPAFLHLTILL